MSNTNQRLDFPSNSNPTVQIWYKYEFITKKFYLIILILLNVQGICLHILYLKLVFLSLYVFYIIWIFKIVDTVYFQFFTHRECYITVFRQAKTIFAIKYT